MRRFGDVFESVVSVGNLWGAWRDFCRGKSGRPSVQTFEPEADRETLRLHRELTGGIWRPGGYRLVMLREPKARLVAAAPVRDRVVHHAVHRVLAPLLDPGLIDGAWACLSGRGSHRALLSFLGAMRRFPWVMTLDIRHYFLSIDRAILMEIMGRRIKDRPLLDLLAAIADSGAGLYRHPGVAEFLGLADGFPPEGCGLPIGNLTSQWWGNHYLSGLDHFAQRSLKIPHYQRYMDDMALFADSRAQLDDARQAMAEWLARERRLILKHPNAPPRPTGRAVTYLGQRISPTGIRPSQRQVRRLQIRVAELVREGDEEAIRRSIASYRGILV